MISDEELRHWFTYHAPGPGDPEAYVEIREAGLQLARAIVKNTAMSADQTAAVRKVREAVMTANQARACDRGPGKREAQAAGS
jgi:hypothetical protein